jgi:arylsulfatase A-like enzyme
MAVMPKTLRWFAAQGTRFTNAVATTPLCCPSRASIFSGQYAHNHGVLQNETRGELDLNYTIQRYLHDSGYTTGIVGKFLNYWNTCVNPPDFDRWSLLDGLYFNFKVNEQGQCGARTGYTTTYLKDKALDFIRDVAPGANPWFLYVAVPAPHGFGNARAPDPERRFAGAPIPPFHPPPSYFELDRRDKPPWVRIPRWTSARIQEERQGTLRTLMSVDGMVDAIFNELHRTGEDDNTLAVFVSDNGFLWGEHGEISKGSPYAEAARIPMFMRWPAWQRGSRIDNRLVANIDLVPTALAAAGITPSENRPLDGRLLQDTTWARDHILLEFWSLLNTPDTREPTFASTFALGYEYTEWFEDDALTPKLWPSIEGGGAVQEYYNLASDPFQLTNILHDGNLANDPAVGPLAAQLATDRTCAGHGPPGELPPPCP